MTNQAVGTTRRGGNGLHAHDQYTELKTIWIDLSDPKEGDNVG